jgi:hypothetical protein
MANQEHLKILKRGVGLWNRWREKSPDIRPDLSGANLYGANLNTANLIKADLSRANLVKADLSRANLSTANLRGAFLMLADLRAADLSEADLSEADLRAAGLSKAHLSGAHLSRAHLSRAEFSGAIVGATGFVDLDLSAVKGLETIGHQGPSFIDIHTIHRSRGKIPEAFLRGAGVPDTFIAYIASPAAEAIQYCSCFISYSNKDEAFARRLHAELQQKGVRCWFAPEYIKGNRKLYDQLDQVIRPHEELLLILSEHSIHSEWVMSEIRQARKAEAREGRRKLFPIRLVDWEMLKAWKCFDADSGKDLAVEVREYLVPDFSQWKDPDSYQQAFTRLLRDLKASEA